MVTALYAEDDPNDVTLLKVILRECQQPFDLRVVRDGEAAIAYLAGQGEFADRLEHPLPAVVILDIKMPHRGGFQVLAWIRAQPLFRSLPVMTSVPQTWRRTRKRRTPSALMRMSSRP